MSQERTNLEVIAPTVEEAVAKGLSQLGLAPEAVEVVVLDAGSRGLFGLGSRQARVKLTIKDVVTPVVNEPVSRPLETPAPAPVETPRPMVSAEPAPAVPAAAESEDRTLRVARETVSELLDKMKVNATVTAHFIEPESAGEDQQVLVDVQGDDLSILIGRRSETLNALQYIASLIVGKELEHWVPMVIDVQGYRARRDRQLRQLARRMAEQAVHTGKRQVLEPMPASERRVIHLELRDHAQVFTESTGDEPNRKVTINLKKQS
ncbi:MAG TPA: RNA-binding cell elongation regulator Jag/EloR [Anaerolineaceae bacterium]